jgi:Ca-activated chloride channel family protein
MPMRLSISLAALVLALLSSDCPPSAFAQEKTANDRGAPEGVVHRHVDLVSIYFTVRDNNKRLANDLPQDKFGISEDGHPQPIKFFAHHSDVLLSLGILLDTGTNMSWILGEEAQASALFIKHVVRPRDLSFILSYASRVETVQLPTSDVALLEQQAHSIQTGAAIGLPDQGPPASRGVSLPGGGTVGINGKPVNKNREAHLYDAARVATLRYLSGEVGRKAVVIVALSGDSQSESTMEDALQTLLENDVIAYVLQIHDAPGRDKCDVLHIFENDTLKKLAEATGGRVLEVHGMDKLEPALDEISEELHHQYSLGYYPENKNWDGNFRKIQISAADKGYKVYARKGYYAKRPEGTPSATQ